MDKAHVKIKNKTQTWSDVEEAGGWWWYLHEDSVPNMAGPGAVMEREEEMEEREE